MTSNLHVWSRGARSARRGAGRLAVALAAGLVLSACRQDMHDAPRYDPLEASPVLLKGASAQPIVAGTVARDHLNEDTLLHTGLGPDGKPSMMFPFAMTRADLDRGQERFNIYCAPCHGRTGDGNGMVVQRGFRQAASYHVDRLREMPAGYFVDVMTNGFGAMPDYKMQIRPEDRWRVAAYIRALQLSRFATSADVPAGELSRLNQAPGTQAK